MILHTLLMSNHITWCYHNMLPLMASTLDCIVHISFITAINVFVAWSPIRSKAQNANIRYIALPISHILQCGYYALFTTIIQKFSNKLFKSQKLCMWSQACVLPTQTTTVTCSTAEHHCRYECPVEQDLDPPVHPQVERLHQPLTGCLLVCLEVRILSNSWQVQGSQSDPRGAYPSH